MKNARLWSIDELVAALDGILDLDVTLKGRNGQASTPGQFRLAFSLWLADHVGRRPAR